jgi:DNA-binding transcriptional ArsR family regulator
MVEYTFSLNLIFHSLSDSTRRDILKRVGRQEMSVGEIAAAYPLTFAAISKHLKVLEKASLIVKRRNGKEQIVSLAPGALAEAADYLKFYQQMWEERMDALEQYLQEDKEK